MRKFRALCLSLSAVGVLGVAQAQAVTVDGAGQVVGWGVTPFVNSSPSGVASVRQNNTSPITYPSGVGAVPSPGGATGEKFDLEELHIRSTGNHVEVLLVSSSMFTASAGNTYNLGDLLIDTNGDTSGYELGVVTNASNAGLIAGRLYSILTTKGLQNIGGSYVGYPSIAAAVGPWAANTGDSTLGYGAFLSEYTIENTTHDYSTVDALNAPAKEMGTNVSLYQFDLPEGYAWQTLNFQLAWGCGNDVIRASYDRPPQAPPPDGAVPEPASAALSVMGLIATAAAALRRRRH